MPLWQIGKYLRVMQPLSTYQKNPELLDAQAVEELWQIVEQHPTYQAARLLLVRGLLQLQDPRFGAALRKAALMVPDRSKLFELVEGNKYDLQTDRKATRRPAADKSEDRTLSLIDSFLADSTDEQRPRRQHPVDASVDYMSYLLQLEDAPQSEDAPLEEEVQGSEELDEQSSLPAAAPLRRSGFSPVENVAPEAEAFEDDQTDEWPADEEAESDNSAPSKDYFTETLARIYIKQCKYDKAIEIIRRLSLNYPKKSRYFADQIRFLEKLLLNERLKNEEK